MKKRYMFAIGCLFCAILVACVIVIFTINQYPYNERGVTTLNERDPARDPAESLSNPISEGILSTGIKYEFHGEFDFNEFRQEYGFHLERKTGSTVVVTNYTEAAEAGQFYLSPLWRNIQEPREHVDGESWFVVVRYCPNTDNWIVQYVLPEASRKGMLGEPSIFAINGSTGSIIEFSRNRGSAHILDGQGGWQRTMGEQENIWRRLFGR